MEAQPVAQSQPPEQAIPLDNVSGDHLRMRHVGVVNPVQGVEDHEAVVAGDERGGDDRVEESEIGLRHEAEQAVFARGPGDCWHRETSAGELQKLTPPHPHDPDLPFAPSQYPQQEACRSTC
ncbi:hypothetical protein MKK88_31190 [Methylobacterium sp. E-005]|nr:hypothetical protein [Methylobacterium sp. E-005]MCJ2090412.1 hypothetical protein [Methylobacterium sp. E-005]